MKALLLASALILGGAAVAQTTNSGPQGTHSGHGTGTTMSSDQSTTAKQPGNNRNNKGREMRNSQSSGKGSTMGKGSSQGTGSMNSGSMSSGSMSSGSMSDGSMSSGSMSSGSMSDGSMSSGAGGSAMAGNYPPCSRSVTDNCMQTNERGTRRRPRR